MSGAWGEWPDDAGDRDLVGARRGEPFGRLFGEVEGELECDSSGSIGTGIPDLGGLPRCILESFCCIVSNMEGSSGVLKLIRTGEELVRSSSLEGEGRGRLAAEEAPVRERL